MAGQPIINKQNESQIEPGSSGSVPDFIKPGSTRGMMGMATASLIGPSKVAAFAISVLLCASSPGLAEAESILTFDAPGAAAEPVPNAPAGTQALAVNAFGKVIGFFVDPNSVCHGFVRSPDGAITTVDAPGAGVVPGSYQGTVLESINLEGTIAGQYQDANYVYHSFLREPDGRFVLFDAPGAGTGANQGTIAVNINLEGEISGFTIDNHNVNHGFFRSRRGSLTLFDAPNAAEAPNARVPQGTVTTLETGLNVFGATIGWYYDATGKAHGYVRERNGAITEFDPPGSVGTYPGSISPEGVIVGGASDTSGILHGFIRTARGAITTFDVPGATKGALALGITPCGLITGYWVDSNAIYHGFVRAPNGAITKFDAPGAGTIPLMSQGTVPQGMNDWGEVAGFLVDSKKVFHGFIRFP